MAVSFSQFDLLPGCVTTIWAILHALSEEKMKKWLTGISTSQLKPFTTELLSVMRNATLEIVYPEMWTGLIMLQHSVVCCESSLQDSCSVCVRVRMLLLPHLISLDSKVRKTMKQVSTSMLTLFTNGNNFDEEIWAAYLQLAFGASTKFNPFHHTHPLSISFVPSRAPLDLLICESLRLESVSEKKRTFIIEHHGDLRLHITKEIRFNLPCAPTNLKSWV